MGIAVAPPRQLAPTVGNLRAGVMAFAAQTSAIYNPSVPEESICFGSLTFRPHSPALRSAFTSFHGGEELVFGDLRFHIDSVGSFRLPDPTRSAPGETTPSSTTLVSSTTSSAGSYSKAGLTSASTSTSTFCIDCDTIHVTGPNDLAKDHDGGSADHESRERTRHECMKTGVEYSNP
jgi:hypothetical protein